MIQTDNFRKSEQYFSLVRWIVLIGVAILAYRSTYLDYLAAQEDMFLSFLGFGVIYSLIIQLILWMKSFFHKFYHVFSLITILMDLVGFLWLISLTGGITSLFTPLLLLVVIHGLIYWRLKGFLVLITIILIGFTGVGLYHEQFIDEWNLWVFGFHMVLLFLVGASLLLVTREQKPEPVEINHFDEAIMKDPLTGLYNHRSFHNTTEKLVSHERKFTLILIDIDNFDELNQKYGYVIGDHILTAFGHTLRHSVSRTDGYSFRYGGEDFAVLSFLTNQQEIEKAITYWNNDFNSNLESIEEYDGEWITLSYGIAVHEKNETKEQLLNRANLHLRQAKERGKNQAVFDHA